MLNISSLILVCTLSLVFIPSAAAQDRSGVRPEVLSLPDGPGSIEGLGESFEPNASTGTSSYSVPIAVPPGVAGFVPSLALRYSSGAGNGELGIGWSLGIPSVQRGTDRGLPTYEDADDVFVVRGMGARGAEDLVELPDGSFRFRIEGAFVRGRRRADGSWEFRNRSGVIFRFGTNDGATTDAATIEDPSDGSRVFAWFLTEQEDTHGHLIRYEYARDETGHPYLERVVWNDFSPDTRNEVVFTREARADGITSFLPGFADQIARRTTRIDVQHGGALVRRYELGYEMMIGLSRMTSVRMVGRDGTTALPTLSLDYIDFDPSAASVVTMTSAPSRALGDVTEISDVDGDALPDLLVADPALDGGQWSWIPNLDGATWGAREVLTSSPSVWLASRDVQLADIDGDGAADAVARVSSASDGFRFWSGAAAGGFGPSTTIAPNPSFGFEDADVRLADLDHDRLSDWMRIDPTTGDVYVSFNRGGGAFAPAIMLPPISSTETVSFSRSGARFSDMNGDGLTDIAVVRSDSVRYWPGVGRGRFGAEVSLAGAPTLSMSELAQTEVRDVNGDGLADLIHVGVSRVRVWTSQAATSLVALMDITGTPERLATTVVRVADMNANGTADIVWVDPASATPWRYLDLLPAGTPGLLARIDNGLGLVTSVDYAGLGEMRRWARAEGVTWTRRSPIGQSVVLRTTTESGLDPELVIEMRYADGHYDGAAREFRGFARSFRIEIGDVAQPTLVTDLAFDVGDADEARKGLELTRTRATESGEIFDTTSATWDVRTITTGADGTPVRYAVRRGEERESVERGTEPRVVRTELDEDEHGNVIHEASFGEVLGDDVAVGDDERIVDRTYATDTSRWILDRVASEVTRDGSGARVAESRTYYDGPAYEGLALGQVERGDVSRTESWIENDRFADLSRVARDEHGNAVVIFDARGARHEMDYDTASSTYVITERILPDDALDHALVWRAEHDEALGRTLTLVEANGDRGEVVYDALGRVDAFIRSGDTRERPTTQFTYTLGVPLSSVRTESREVSGEDGTVVEIAWTDGLARPRGTYREAEDGEWAVEGLVSYGARAFADFSARPSFERSADLDRDLAGRTGVTTEYDALARGVRTIEVDGAETRTEYTPLGRSDWDENDTDLASSHAGTPTRYEHDGLGRLRRVVWLDGTREVTTGYRWNALDQLAVVTDAEARVRSYRYDGRARLVRSEDPNAGVWLWSYSDGGDLERRTDPTGRVVRSVHDRVGRLTEEWHTFPGEAERLSVRAHYDEASPVHPELGFARGQAAWIEDDAGTIFFGYDARGRVTDRIRRLEDGREYATWTDFDTMGRPARRGFPDATHLEFRYDDRGLLEGLSDAILSVDWTAWGAAESIEYGNGVIDERGFDSRQRMRTMTATRVDATGMRVVLRDLEHTLDPASRITSVDDRRAAVNVEDDLGASYVFDDLYRLTDSTDAIATTSWSYDDVGNIQTVTSGHADSFLNIVNRYGEAGAGPDQLTHAGDEEFVYDLAGRVIADGTRTLEYDAAGRLSRVVRDSSGGDTAIEEYVYAHDGTRVVKRTISDGAHEETIYVDRDVEVRDDTLVRYVFVGSERVIRLDALAGEGVGAITEPLASPISAASMGTATLAGSSLRGRGAFFVGFATLAWFGCGAAGLVLLILILRRRLSQTSWVRPALVGSVALVVVFGCQPPVPSPLRAVSTAVVGWPAGAVLYLADHLSSPVTVVDEEGAAADEAPRHPFGSSRGGARRTGDPWDYVGNEADQGSGLSDFGARSYRPELGRFYAGDPILLAPSASDADLPMRFQSYSYSASDPVNGRDQAGLWVVAVGISVELGLGVGAGAQVGFYIEGGRYVTVGVFSSTAEHFGISNMPYASAGITVSFNSGQLEDFEGFTVGFGASGDIGVGAGFEVAVPWSTGDGVHTPMPSGGATTYSGTLSIGVGLEGHTSVGVTTALPSAAQRAEWQRPRDTAPRERSRSDTASRRASSSTSQMDASVPSAPSSPATPSAGPQSEENFTPADPCGHTMSC